MNGDWQSTNCKIPILKVIEYGICVFRAHSQRLRKPSKAYFIQKNEQDDRFAHCADAVGGVKKDYVATEGYDPVTRRNSRFLTVSANSQAPGFTPIYQPRIVVPNDNQATRPVY